MAFPPANPLERKAHREDDACRYVELEQLDWSCVARSRSEASVTRNQYSAELFGKHHISCIVCRKFVAESPNLRQQHEMGIASDPEVQQIVDRFIRTVGCDRSFPHQTPQYLGDL